MKTALPIEADQLSGWAAFANRVRCAGFNIKRRIASGDLAAAKEDLLALSMEGAAALVSMEQAGAELPAGLPYAPPVPLEMLDTAANRRLARTLRDALDAAAAVDRERGQDGGEEYEGPACLHLAEMLAKVELEVFGPAGRGEGARG